MHIYVSNQSENKLNFGWLFSHLFKSLEEEYKEKLWQFHQKNPSVFVTKKPRILLKQMIIQKVNFYQKNSNDGKTSTILSGIMTAINKISRLSSELMKQLKESTFNFVFLQLNIIVSRILKLPSLIYKQIILRNLWLSTWKLVPFCFFLDSRSILYQIKVTDMFSTLNVLLYLMTQDFTLLSEPIVIMIIS